MAGLAVLAVALAVTIPDQRQRLEALETPRLFLHLKAVMAEIAEQEIRLEAAVVVALAQLEEPQILRLLETAALELHLLFLDHLSLMPVAVVAVDILQVDWLLAQAVLAAAEMGQHQQAQLHHRELLILEAVAVAVRAHQDQVAQAAPALLF